jgi:hypothetical protein
VAGWGQTVPPPIGSDAVGRSGRHLACRRAGRPARRTGPPFHPGCRVFLGVGQRGGRGAGRQDAALTRLWLVRTAGFPTCRIADCPIGSLSRSLARPVPEPSAGWETRDTADWEVCGTPAVAWRRKAARSWFATVIVGRQDAALSGRRDACRHTPRRAAGGAGGVVLPAAADGGAGGGVHFGAVQ